VTPVSWLRVVEGTCIALLLWAAFHLGQVVKQGEWDAAVLSQRKGEDAAIKAAAEAIAKIEVKSEKYIQPVRTEIRTNTVYAECQHSADSLRNLNALITGAEPIGSSSVSASSATR